MSSTTLRRIYRGARYSERFGSHPGTFYVGFFLCLGFLAGGLRGVGVMAAVLVPLWLWGCYERGAS